MAAPCSAVNYLRWDLSAQQIGELTTELIEETKRVYDRVGSQELQDVSYENTLKVLADVEVSYTGEPCPDWATPPPPQGPGGERQPGLASLLCPRGPRTAASGSVCQFSSWGAGSRASLETGAPSHPCPCACPGICLFSLSR